MKKILILLLLIGATTLTLSRTLEGVGYGKSEKEAKKEALADLSNQIEVKITSEFKSNRSVSDGNTTHNVSSGISTLSNTNILGVDFEITKKMFRSKYTAIAKLDETKIKIYEKKVNELRNEIDSDYSKSEMTDDLEQKKNLLVSVLRNYGYYDSYKSVAIILGSKRLLDLPYTKTDIKNLILGVQKEIDSDSLYNGINILYIKSSGNFKNNEKDFFDNQFNSLLAEISKDNNNKITISDKNGTMVTTLVKVVLNSNITRIKPAVFYNKKMITPETFETSVNITVEMYNKKKVTNILSMTTTGKGTDINSTARSYEKAVKNGFTQMKAKLKKTLIK